MPGLPGPLEQYGLVGLTVGLGAFGGWVANKIGTPLPWMMGSMVITTTAALLHVPLRIPMGFRALMVTVLGVMLGSGFTPDILDRLSDWSVSITALFAYVGVSGLAGVFFFRRCAGYDPVTAYFSGMPGGLSEMTIVGEAMGGDSRVISLTHSARILLVVMILPFAFQFLFGYDPANKPVLNLSSSGLSASEFGVLVLCGAAGFLIAKALRVPAAAIVGPMFLSAAVHLAGWTQAQPPGLLVAAAQVVVGSAIGCRFAGTDFVLIRRAVLAAVGGTVTLVAVTVAFAVTIRSMTDLQLEALVLAYSPGGLAEMSLIAIALGSDAAFVATHHILRIFIIVVLAPTAYRVFRRRTQP